MPVLKMWNGTEWVPVGTPPTTEVIQKAGEIFLWPSTQSHPFALPCDGTTFSATTYPQLAAFLGSTTLPNMQGRFVVGQTSGAGGHPLDVEFDTMGETGGVKSVTLTANQSGLKAHDHPYDYINGGTDGAFTSNDGLQAKSAGTGTRGTWAENNAAIGQNAAQNASEAHTNLPPYIVMRYMIRTVDGKAISNTNSINAVSVRRLMASNVVFSNPTSVTVFPAGAEKTALTTTITKRAGSKLLLDVRGTVLNSSGVAQPVTLGLRINGVDYAVSTFVIPQATSRQPFSGVVLTPAITAGGSLSIEPWIQSGGIILEFRGPNEDTLSYSVLEVAEDGGASSGFTLPDRLSTNTGSAITDFNSARAAGWYTASATTTNAPRTGQWWFVEAVQFPNDNNTLQRATIMNGTEAWQRTYDNGVWSSWTASGGLVGEIPKTLKAANGTSWTGSVRYQKYGNVVTVWIDAAKSSWAVNDVIGLAGFLPVGIRPEAGGFNAGYGINATVNNEDRNFWLDTDGSIKAAAAGTGSIYGTMTYQVSSAERSTAMASGAETTAIPAGAGAGTVAADTVAYVRGGQVYVNLNMSPTPGLAAGSTLFTLPVGYRPPTVWWELMPIVTAAESTIRLNVLPDGRVQNQVAIPSGVPILRGSMKFPAALSVAGLGTLVDTGWINFTPSMPNNSTPNTTAMTVQYAKYRRIGNTVKVRTSITLTGGVAGPVVIDPPFPFASDTVFAEHNVVGRARGRRANVAWYEGAVCPQVYASVNRLGIYAMEGSGAQWTANSPATWVSGDSWSVEYEYEAAPL